MDKEVNEAKLSFGNIIAQLVKEKVTPEVLQEADANEDAYLVKVLDGIEELVSNITTLRPAARQYPDHSFHIGLSIRKRDVGAGKGEDSKAGGAITTEGEGEEGNYNLFYGGGKINKVRTDLVQDRTQLDAYVKAIYDMVEQRRMAKTAKPTSTEEKITRILAERKQNKVGDKTEVNATV